jgi:hypothetical protein
LANDRVICWILADSGIRRAWRGMPLGGTVQEGFSTIGEELRLWLLKQYRDRETAALEGVRLKKELGVEVRPTRVGLP